MPFPTALSRVTGSTLGNILIVEDDAAVRELVSVLLRTNGFHAVAAEDGLEALHLLRTVRRRAPRTPCLVLLDLVMPVMNGVEFLQALERRRDIRQVRVALVSAYSVVDRVALGSPRIVGRLHKPVDMGELRQVLDGQLGSGFGRPLLPN